MFSNGPFRMTSLSRVMEDSETNSGLCSLELASPGPGPVKRGGETGPRHVVLILATTYGLPYRVLRCAKSCSAKVYVLGDHGAQALTLSRYCDGYFHCHRIVNGFRDEALALEVNCLVRDLGVTMVLPGDAPSTRALIACRDLLDVPCFPLPSLEQFDCLNDKWRFAQVCADVGMRHPATRYFSTVAELAADVGACGLDYQAVLKPLSLSGNQGLIRLDPDNAREQVRRVNYQPIIMQKFVPGRDVSASILCRDGRVEAFIANASRRRVYSTIAADSILADLVRFATHMGVTGIFNFDIIESGPGEFHYLECNPRFFFKMGLAMLAGLNFVELGMNDQTACDIRRIGDGTTVRAPEAILATPSLWRNLRWRDAAVAAHVLADPIPLLFDQLAWPT